MAEDMVLERLKQIHADIERYQNELGSAIEGLRKEIHGELAVLRAKQAEQDVLNRGMASFVLEINATLARIERKLGSEPPC